MGSKANSVKPGWNKKKIGMILVLGLGGLVILSLSRNIFRLFRAEKEVVSAQKELERLQAEQRALLEKKESMESEAFIEKQARNKLNMAKEGETVIILPEQQEETRDEGNNLPETPPWQKWLAVFGWEV